MKIMEILHLTVAYVTLAIGTLAYFANPQDRILPGMLALSAINVLLAIYFKKNQNSNSATT